VSTGARTLRPLRLAVGGAIAFLLLGGAAYVQRSYPPKRIARIVEALLIWRLTDELNLKENQIARIFSWVRQLKALRLELGRWNREIQEEIKELLRSEPQQSDLIRARVSELRVAREQFARRRNAVIARINSALTAGQQVRFLQIHDKFESDTIQFLQDLERFIHRVPGASPAPAGRP